MLLAAGLPGCCTGPLWKKHAYHPAENPRLRLASSPQTGDILVCYDERCETNKVTRLRAYWLFAYSAQDTNPVDRPKPDFVNPSTFTNLAAIQLLTTIPTANSIPGNDYSVMPSPDQYSFALWQHQTKTGDYKLPVYRAAPLNSYWRVGLTPLAVAGDTAIVGAVIGVMGMGAGFGPGGR